MLEEAEVFSRTAVAEWGHAGICNNRRHSSTILTTTPTNSHTLVVVVIITTTTTTTAITIDRVRATMQFRRQMRTPVVLIDRVAVVVVELEVEVELVVAATWAAVIIVRRAT